MANVYTNYSMEALISMRKSIDEAINEKKKQAYDEALTKVLEALEIMAKDYPHEDAYESDDYDCLTWKDIYDGAIRNVWTHHGA